MNEIAVKEFELIKNDLILLYEAKGMRASGSFADSLEVVSKQNVIQLYGLDYAEQLQFGREAGSYPNIEAIKKWIIDKGVFAEALQKMKISSLAFLIARKISLFGWKRERYGGVDLISEVITPERINDIINKIGVSETVKLTSEIYDYYNQTISK